MTGLGPSPLRLGVFAGDIPIAFFAFFAPFAVKQSRLLSEGAMNRAPTL